MAIRKTPKATSEALAEGAAKPAKAAPKKAPAKAKKAETAPVLLPEIVEAPTPKAAKAPRKTTKPKADVPAETAPAIDEPKAPVADLSPAILAALREGRAVEFIFADADANPPRTFEPRQLTFDALAQAWYVWGWDRRYNAERFHRVDLLAEVNAVEGVGRSAQGPYKEGTPSNQIGGWLGGEPIPVKATLMKQWIFAVKQGPAPFPEFKIVDAEDGKATVTFTGTDLRAIARWCMQFGDGIQVQEPQRLVERIKQVGLAWGGKPAAAPSPAPAKAKFEERRPEPKHEPKHEARHDSHRSEHRREERKEHREEPKAAKGPKVEVRIERL